MNELDRASSGELSRRHLLQLLGVTATGSLAAACQGGTREQAAGPGTPASGGLFQGWYPYDAPPKGNINLLPGVSASITIGYFYDWILLPGAMYYWASQDYFYLLADPSSSLSEDGTTFTYRVRPGLKWSDGKPVTGKDVYTTWCLEYVMASPAFTYVDKVTQTDDMTVTFHIKMPAPIAQYYILRGQIVSDAVYGQFLAEAEPFVKELTPAADKRMAQLVQKISAFKPEKVTASGPFTFDMDRLTTQQLTLVKNPRGYLAKQVKFDRATVHTHQGINVLATLALSGKIDYGTGGWPVTIEKELEKKGLRIIRPPTYFGPALFVNHGKLPEFRDKRVRQALAHAIDRAQEGRAALGESGKDVELMAGFSDLQVPQWLSEADLAKLNRYEHDHTKAADLLTAAGWKKAGGAWMTPEGKRAAYTLIYPSQFPDWASAAQNLESQLSQFGFKITLRGVDMAEQPIDVQSGKFELAIQGWGSSGNPWPTASFDTDLLAYNYPVTKPNRGMDFPLVQETDSVGRIDFAKAIPDSGRGANDEELKAKITDLALAFNELLPIIPLFERYDNDGINTKNIAGFPPDDDPIYRNSIYADNFVTILLYKGVLRPA
jgi:peptide/nickel transport system substrate-binding protein